MSKTAFAKSLGRVFIIGVPLAGLTIIAACVIQNTSMSLSGVHPSGLSNLDRHQGQEDGNACCMIRGWFCVLLDWDWYT